MARSNKRKNDCDCEDKKSKKQKKTNAVAMHQTMMHNIAKSTIVKNQTPAIVNWQGHAPFAAAPVMHFDLRRQMFGVDDPPPKLPDGSSVSGSAPSALPKPAPSSVSVPKLPSISVPKPKPERGGACHALLPLPFWVLLVHMIRLCNFSPLKKKQKNGVGTATLTGASPSPLPPTCVAHNWRGTRADAASAASACPTRLGATSPVAGDTAGNRHTALGGVS
jgi:hypothetical protein